MAAARIDLSGLSKELDAFRSKFEKWCYTTVERVESKRDGHLKAIKELQGGWPTPTGAGDQAIEDSLNIFM
jgi:hypothetical protein